jgi:NhaP-type Na+/H+ or K+/H+ antiporter
VTNPTVPSRIRQLITVESGLNDGIATPVVMVAIAGAAATAGLESAEGAGPAVIALLVGATVGAVVGGLGGWLMRQARRRGSAAEDFAGIAVLALALLAYAAALAVNGNGFVAAFCGGLAFGACAGRRGPAELIFVEQMSSLVSLLVWLAFGAIAIPIMLQRLDILTVVYGGSASPSCGWCRCPSPRSAPASTGTPCCSSAGSARAASRRWSLPCLPWTPWGRSPMRH